MDNDSLNIRKLYLRSYPDPILRQIAQPVEKIDETIVDLAEKMVDVMIEAKGVGLAAPQVGVSLRLIVISLTGTRDDVEYFVNPVLDNFQGVSEMEEGCLSVPGIRAKVRRYAACNVTASDLEGNKFVMDAVDLGAIVLQHEVDHLDGTLFIDRLSSLSRIACRKGLKQLERDYE